MKIAKDHGLITDDSLEAMAAALDKGLQNGLSELTAKTRFAMFLRGELELDTSTPFVPEPWVPFVVDPFWIEQSQASRKAQRGDTP